MGNKIDIQNTQSKRDDFIVQYNNSNSNKIMDIASFDQRRVVFISLSGLYNTYYKCPSVVLYSALCLLPLKRNWIYQPKKYMHEIKQKDEIFRLFHKDLKKTKTFLNLLKWKDAQGFVFFMLDDEELYNNNDTDDLIAAFWRAFSAKLTTLYNPITGTNYEPIIFDNKFWRNKSENYDNHSSKYRIKTYSILAELYSLSSSKKYKSIQEIIYQSNPKSLNPIISYGQDYEDKTEFKFDNATINGDDGWIISSDY